MPQTPNLPSTASICLSLNISDFLRALKKGHPDAIDLHEKWQVALDHGNLWATAFALRLPEKALTDLEKTSTATRREQARMSIAEFNMSRWSYISVESNNSLELTGGLEFWSMEAPAIFQASSVPPRVSDERLLAYRCTYEQEFHYVGRSKVVLDAKRGVQTA